MKKKTRGLLLFHLVIFFTGFSFLVFEISWFRMLSLVIGATVSASTIVLVAFMLGVGLGGYFWGKKLALVAHPIKWLCGMLTAIAIMGLINRPLITYFIPQLYLFFNASHLLPALTEFLVFVVAALALFAPAFLMGGILPIISSITVHTKEELAGGIGKIYALETLGSTLGGFITGFFLLGNVGQNNTLLLPVSINLLLAGVLLLAKKFYPSHLTNDATEEIRNTKQESKQKKIVERKEASPINQKTATLATFICGFVVVGMQIIWIRIFRVYMTNTSYTFSLIASMVILGLFGGSWWYSKRGKKITEPNHSLLKSIVWMAFFLLVGFFILLKLPSLLVFPLASEQNTYLIRIILVPFLASLFIIIPVTFISGYVFPLACALYSSHQKEISASVGSVLLANTLGSVFGPLMAAYILIPFLGAGLSVLFFLIAVLLVAFILLVRIQTIKKMSNLKLFLIASMGLLLIVLIARPRVYILPPSFSKFKKEILAYKETIEGTYVVGKESNENNTVLSTYVNNSTVIGSTYDAIKAVKMVGHIPFFAGLQCNSALVIGFGIGVTTSAIASHPEVKSIDCVELVSGLKEAAHFYGELNNHIEKDPRLTIHSGDGRHYLQSSSKKYDLLSSDPTHPILGSGNIYTKEYFELCRAHLNSGGMVSQYLPLHKLLLKDFMGIIKTFHSVFPDASVWIGHYHAVLIGSNGNRKIDFSTWANNISKSAQDVYFYNNPYHVAACMVMDSAQIANTTKKIAINTDDLSYLEFFSFASFKSENLTTNLNYLSQNRVNVDKLFYHIEDTTKMKRFIKGNSLLTDGLSYFLQGNANEFRKKLERACQENPEDEEFPFLIKFYFR
jgi:spermidine synthase